MRSFVSFIHTFFGSGDQGSVAQFWHRLCCVGWLSADMLLCEMYLHLYATSIIWSHKTQSAAFNIIIFWKDGSNILAGGLKVALVWWPLQSISSESLFTYTLLQSVIPSYNIYNKYEGRLTHTHTHTALKAMRLEELWGYLHSDDFHGWECTDMLTVSQSMEVNIVWV